jgi:DnaJ homolog subfamily C member 28
MADKNEEQIRKAMEEGQFDNLPGKGKPLNLDENPFEDPEWRMAHHLLKEGGFSLPWIEGRREIDKELAAARERLRTAWRARQASLDRGAAIELVQYEWSAAVDVFKKKIEVLNRQIRDYNLQTPLLQFQMLSIQTEREIQKITEGR